MYVCLGGDSGSHTKYGIIGAEYGDIPSEDVHHPHEVGVPDPCAVGQLLDRVEVGLLPTHRVDTHGDYGAVGHHPEHGASNQSLVDGDHKPPCFRQPPVH